MPAKQMQVHYARTSKAAGNNSRGTPRDFYEWLNSAFAFSLDVCAEEHNAKHPRFYSEKENGLLQSWADETAFMNPPYGDDLPVWMRKAFFETTHRRAVIVALVPARTDTAWWNSYVLARGLDVGHLRASYLVPESGVFWLRWEALVTGFYFHDQRLNFAGSSGDSAPFPSAVVIHAHPSRALHRANRPLQLGGRQPLTIGAPL